MDYETIMWRVRRQMGRSGLTQQQLADKLGISQPMVSYRLNHKNIGVRQLIELCRALGLRVEVRPADE